MSRSYWFEDDAFEFAARAAVGHAAMGNVDIGPVLAVLERITDGDPRSWYDEWVALAEHCTTAAEAAEKAGHLRTAGWFRLGASECFDNSIAFVDGMDNPQEIVVATFTRQQDAFERFIDTTNGLHVRIDVPLDNGSLPGYVLRPDASGARRATVVVTNGSDGSLTSLWATVVAPALQRDLNVVIFDGPGQQRMLFERGIPFRPDWEAVLTPVTDAVLARADVDGSSLFGFGISQGGFWLPRALAFEHRYRAAAVDGGVVDVTTAWEAHLPPHAFELARRGDRDGLARAFAGNDGDAATKRNFAFRAKPYGAVDPVELLTQVNEYRLGDLAGQITTPLLVVAPDDEQFWPGQSQALFDQLTQLHGADKVLLHTDRRWNGNGHCPPLARGLIASSILDFFAEHTINQSRSTT